jgi:hypothetical protein
MDAPVETRPAVLVELLDGRIPKDTSQRELETTPVAATTRSERSPFCEQAPLSALNASSSRIQTAPSERGMSYSSGPTDDFETGSSPNTSASISFMASLDYQPEVGGRESTKNIHHLNR